ncbi:hypothetical protein FDUTEX481_04213 [Tolypothrix sp. PCC 7601]|nr:hypothetical protein FDUTEX481_04213 [Tolypothrix sp. PCC 7601]
MFQITIRHIAIQWKRRKILSQLLENCRWKDNIAKNVTIILPRQSSKHLFCR